MRNSITSLSELLGRLEGATSEEYKSIGVDLNIPVSDFKPFAYWSVSGYTRNCIIRRPNFELLLLCWSPGQETPIHCHGGEECWVYLLDGQIEEIHYDFVDDKLLTLKSGKMMPGDKSFMSDDNGYHKLINQDDSRSMSLHLYMNPIDSCTFYDARTNSFVSRTLSYHSYNGEIQTAELTK